MGKFVTSTIPVWTVDQKEKQNVLKGKKDQRDKKVFNEWESTVTQNPFHSEDGKITKVRTLERTYRWKKPPYRVVYDVYENNHTIYPVEFKTRGNIKTYS